MVTRAGRTLAFFSFLSMVARGGAEARVPPQVAGSGARVATAPAPEPQLRVPCRWVEEPDAPRRRLAAAPSRRSL